MGVWNQAQFANGTWRLKDTGEFIGSFKNGKPDGQGKFVLSNGITHSGKYVATPSGDAAGEEEEEVGARTVVWQGEPVYSC